MNDAWEDLKTYLVQADKNLVEMYTKMRWFELLQSPSIFSEILDIMKELEEKYEED